MRKFLNVALTMLTAIVIIILITLLFNTNVITEFGLTHPKVINTLIITTVSIYVLVLLAALLLSKTEDETWKNSLCILITIIYVILSGALSCIFKDTAEFYRLLIASWALSFIVYYFVIEKYESFVKRYTFIQDSHAHKRYIIKQARRTAIVDSVKLSFLVLFLLTILSC